MAAKLERRDVLRLRIRYWTKWMVAVAAACLSLSAPAGVRASAAVWQVATSLHCDNVALCSATPEQRLGGDGGPLTFYADGTGFAEFTTYAHFFAGGPAVGATHIAFAVSAWHIALGGNGALVPGSPDFYWDDGTATITYQSGPPVTVSLADAGAVGDTGLPASVGHYTAARLFGQSTLGVVIEIVVQQRSG